MTRERERESGTVSASAHKERTKRVEANSTGTIYDLGKQGNNSAWTDDMSITVFEDELWIHLKKNGNHVAEIHVPRVDFEAVLKALGYIVPEVESRVVATQ